MPAALARALAAQAAAVVQTTAFRRRALQVAVQSAAKRFRRGFIPRQLNLPALAGKSLIDHNVRIDYGKLRHLVQSDRRLNGNFSRLREIIETGEYAGRSATAPAGAAL